MQLTPNFKLEEFELDGLMPAQCVFVYKALCEKLLEPIRAHFCMAIQITSGYRSPSANESAHGVKNSQHVATDAYCAADFKFVGMKDMRPVFDWLRTKSTLVWDQLILEHESDGADIIHVSLVMETKGTNRRVALEGETANQSAYTTWPVTPFSENSQTEA